MSSRFILVTTGLINCDNSRLNISQTEYDVCEFHEITIRYFSVSLLFSIAHKFVWK